MIVRDYREIAKRYASGEISKEMIDKLKKNDSAEQRAKAKMNADYAVMRGQAAAQANAARQRGLTGLGQRGGLFAPDQQQVGLAPSQIRGFKDHSGIPVPLTATVVEKRMDEWSKSAGEHLNMVFSESMAKALSDECKKLPKSPGKAVSKIQNGAADEYWDPDKKKSSWLLLSLIVIIPALALIGFSVWWRFW